MPTEAEIRTSTPRSIWRARARTQSSSSAFPRPAGGSRCRTPTRSPSLFTTWGGRPHREPSLPGCEKETGVPPPLLPFFPHYLPHAYGFLLALFFAPYSSASLFSHPHHASYP